MRPRFAISLARPARGGGAVGGARAPTGTPEAGGEPTSPGKVNRARPRLGAAPPSAPPTTGLSTVPGRPGPASFRSVRLKGSLLESGPSSNRTGAIISPPRGDVDKECERIYSPAFAGT